MPLINESLQWKCLEEHAKNIQDLHLRDLMQDEERCKTLTAEHEDIILDFSRQRVTETTMDLLYDLCEAAGVSEKLSSLQRGVHVNSTEDRAVMHTALRAPKDFPPVLVDGVNVLPEVHSVIDKISDFATRFRTGKWLGATGKKLTTVVSIGIGGSYLGPEFVFEALRTDPTASALAKGRTLRFLANVDPIDVSRCLSSLNPELTLVVIVSKTFTTAETMLNARTVKNWLITSMPGSKPEEIVKQHMVAVSTATKKVIDFGIGEENIFGFWDWVGGRFSVCSAVGVLPLSLHYGMKTIEQFLAGAHNMDKHFFQSPMRNNIPLLLGLLSVWNSSFLKFPAKAILPYCQGLSKFPAHIQQVDMESNGKKVSIDGFPLPYECGEIVFGEPGTNGQHSFYQLMHQGRIVPAEFIGFSVSPTPIFNSGEVVSNHDELMSNFFAQPDALALGKNSSELTEEGVSQNLIPHKTFEGNRPSLSILFPSLNAFSCGQLLSMYENRVIIQGFIWGINSFDQWGVELGKVLASKVRLQMVKSRKENPKDLVLIENSVSGFNASTSNLLKRYLKTQQS